MLVRIKKLKELPDAIRPDNIQENWKREFEVPEEYFKKPKLNKRFYISISFGTSRVQEIISENTFRTRNSIYEWEIIKK